MRTEKCDKSITRILSVLAAALLLLSQLLWMMPAFAYTETAGDVLVVRVQYYGEIGDKIREKARFTKQELEAMGARTYYYTNITRVGTVMSMAAHGPEVMTIIRHSHIDPGSIQNITFRTTDGYTRNFTVKAHLTAKKYYYPNLAANYERNESGDALTPLEGATSGKQPVPAILALEFGESKKPGVNAEDLPLKKDRTYRFCMGQSDLEEGKMTDPDDGGGDISSMESCHSIYGIDITLSGSPIRGMSLDLDDPNIEVGSMKRISVHLDVDELFADDFTLDDITWISSDPSIAEVDDDGEVTIHKKGTVTITAIAADGTRASITINGIGDEEEEDEEEPKATKKDKPKEKDKKEDIDDDSKDETPPDKEEKPEVEEPEKAEEPEKKAKPISLNAHEIKLGDLVVEEDTGADEFRPKMAEDAQALDEAQTYDPAAAAGTAAGAGVLCGAGAIARIVRYRRNF